MLVSNQWLYNKYSKPKIGILSFNLEGMVCGSPAPGESEDVEYEDWD